MQNPFRITSYSLDNKYINSYFTDLSKFEAIQKELKKYISQGGKKDNAEYIRLENNYKKYLAKVNSDASSVKKYETKIQDNKRAEKLAQQQETHRREQYNNQGIGNQLYISA